MEEKLWLTVTLSNWRYQMEDHGPAAAVTSARSLYGVSTRSSLLSA